MSSNHLLGNDAMALYGHICYRAFVDEALDFMRQNEIATEIADEEQMEYFCCQEFSAFANLYNPRIRSIMVVETLWEALEYIHLGPISADILTYPELFRSGFEIYRGPTTYRYGLIGYHSCNITDVTYVGGEPVAICKLTNGTSVGR